MLSFKQCILMIPSSCKLGKAQISVSNESTINRDPSEDATQILHRSYLITSSQAPLPLTIVLTAPCVKNDYFRSLRSMFSSIVDYFFSLRFVFCFAYISIKAVGASFTKVL